MTANATSEIRSIYEDPQTPEGCGVRITTDPVSGALILALAAMPAPDDHVIDDAGARVFLEQRAASLLSASALDAGTDDTGQVQFSISDPAS